jgi:hypothetical protein
MRVQRRQRALANALSPRTERQIAIAEKHLTDALDGLKARRRFLQSPRTAGGKTETKTPQPVKRKAGTKKRNKSA